MQVSSAAFYFGVAHLRCATGTPSDFPLPLLQETESATELLAASHVPWRRAVLGAPLVVSSPFSPGSALAETLCACMCTWALTTSIFPHPEPVQNVRPAFSLAQRRFGNTLNSLLLTREILLYVVFSTSVI